MPDNVIYFLEQEKVSEVDNCMNISNFDKNKFSNKGITQMKMEYS